MVYGESKLNTRRVARNRLEMASYGAMYDVDKGKTKDDKSRGGEV